MITYGQLPTSGNPTMACLNDECEHSGETWSATRGDYFWADPSEAVTCSACGHGMYLVAVRRVLEILS